MTKHYTRDDMTIVWKPEICQHSAICFHGLAAVFDPRRTPWIDMNAAELERIKEQVARCPSGALSYEQKETQA